MSIVRILAQVVVFTKQSAGCFLAGLGTDATIIDGNAIDRVFHLHANPTSSVTISNVAIQNGTTSRVDNDLFDVGGGIYNESGKLFLQDCGVHSNRAGTGGGGIYSTDSLTVTDCEIDNNVSERDGGGVYNAHAASLTVSGSTINENLSQRGGGIYNQGTLSLHNSIVAGNDSYGDGGGIHNYFGHVSIEESSLSNNQITDGGHGGGFYNHSSENTITVFDTEIINNTATIWGGGIYLSFGNLELDNTLVQGNRANSGSGIYSGGTLTVTQSIITANLLDSPGGSGVGINTQGNLTVLNSTIHNNQATSASVYGGGINVDAGTATLINTTISENKAENGGGIRLSGGTLHITSTTIYNNIATNGGGIFDDPNFTAEAYLNNTIVANNTGQNCNSPGPFGSDIDSSGHNLESSNSCQFSMPGDLTNKNPLLGSLLYHGGSTPTHALLEGSPAIDAGDNASCPASDQRGVARPVDGDENGAAVCDIGAFEFELDEPDPVHYRYMPLIRRP